MRSRSCVHAVAGVCLLAAFSLASRATGAGQPDRVDDAQGVFDFGRLVDIGETMPRLHSFLVSHRGELVFERYFNGREASDAENVKSVSKSILSALVGIALDRGMIGGLGATIGEYFPDYLAGETDAEKAGITVEHLLTMRAGLKGTSNRNYGAWVRSGNWVRYALAQPLESVPGRNMKYSTGDTHLLSAILTKATGRSTLEFARETLAEPLGFRLAPWPRDPQGIYFGGNDMALTPRQMLAFGELYLRGGSVDGRQVVPAEWIEDSLQRRVESPKGEGRYYGYGWWVAELAGHEAPHAWGYGGQFIVLVPDLDLVIVTTSSSRPDASRSAHAGRVYELLQRHVIGPFAAAAAATVTPAFVQAAR